MERFWDKEGKYKDNVLREYSHWSLEVADRQHTLGSFVILAKRPCERISELTDNELIELGKVMRDMEQALSKNFRPDRFNYLQLGNVLHHLHFHGIPRYSSKKTFAGLEWVDVSFGGPPTISKISVDEEVKRSIKNAILKAFVSSTA
jgi:diadenosine tetraphosphate (Ap4A) HIT family hydrolase